MCYICKHIFHQQHQLDNHLNRKTICDKRIKFKCDLCKQGFKSKNGFKNHHNTHRHTYMVNTRVRFIKNKIIELTIKHTSILQRLSEYYNSTPLLDNYYTLDLSQDNSYYILFQYYKNLKNWNHKLRLQIKNVIEIDKYMIENLKL